jgi:hypothetical protein
MSTSADDHTEKGVQIAGSSIQDFESQSDDDCVSENSFGSYLDDNEEEKMTADIELDSIPPGYSDEEYPQSTSVLDDTYVVPQYTPPTRSTQPAFNAKFSGPSMCVVRGLIFYPALISIN